jgi:hypothetical protein
MSTTMHLAQAMEGFFASENLYWFASYRDATAGLSAREAAGTPGARFNSVWGVTLHLTLCQQFALALLRGENVDVGTFFASGAWPAIADPGDEAAWEEAKTNLLAVNHALADCVAGLPEEALDRELPIVGMPTGQYILGQIAHNSNHLNEIVSIRHMQELWLEKV